jgi:transcriptional regulator with XRE-family HTH domain
MSIGNKIKSAMIIGGKNRQDLAAALGITDNAITAKFYRDSFSAEDLIKIADCLGYSLDFSSNDSRITFILDDIKK